MVKINYHLNKKKDFLHSFHDWYLYLP
jgi:hypothetical protein